MKIELSGGETPNRKKDSYNQKPYPESYYQFSSHDGQNLDQDDAQDRISLDPVNTLINVRFWDSIIALMMIQYIIHVSVLHK